jgi:hypothetical protein
MRNVTFQLVLKECVLPNYFVFSKLKNLLELRSEFSEFDMQQAKDAIEILRFTNYEDTNRFLLTFTVDFSIADSLGLDYTQKLILAFGNSFRAETETVEGVFRFQDAYMLDEIIKFHKEIYDIEMKIREVLNYILAYNFSFKDLFNCIEEFEGIDFGNERMKKDPEHRRKIFNDFLETEIFHIIFTKYGLFKYPKALKADMIFDFIKRSDSFDELRNLMQERGITENINPYHKTFINELAASLQQIEDVRNEIMHNREVKESDTYNKLAQKTGYKSAKAKFDELIGKFWEQEKGYRVNDLRQVEFIMRTLIDNLAEDNGSFTYTDLDFADREAEDLVDLKSQFLDIINSNLEINDQDELETVVDKKLSSLESH